MRWCNPPVPAPSASPRFASLRAAWDRVNTLLRVGPADGADACRAGSYRGIVKERVMRFVFSPPGDDASGLLTLPFGLPLEEWRDERLVEVRQRGISRHVVRFVAEGGELYALKSISERLARREYRLLRSLAALNVPAVQVVGVVVDRGADGDAILVTR